MRTQTKTTLLFLLPFLIVLSLFGGFVYFSFLNYSHNDFFRLLEIRAITAGKIELDNNPTANIKEIKELRDQFFEKLPQEKDYFFPLEEVEKFHDESETLGLPISFFENVIKNGKSDFKKNNVFYKGIIYNSTKGKYIIVASAENYYELHHSAYLKRTLFISIIAAFIISALISLYFSKYIFKPLRKITERVNQISSENLHLRLDAGSKNDELNDLAVTFNTMLDRIETSFETQNNFISNASHELRTPLTAIIGEADVILSKSRSQEEYEEAIKIMLVEAEKLESKTRALLFLAQTGFNGKIQKFDKIRLDQLLMDVKETLEKINQKNKICLDMSLLPENPNMIKVNGNEQLLHLAFSNIINNGCKYSDNQPVSVALGASNNSVFVVIKDTGIGIPESELKFIYDPFFRASNTKSYEGFGIGLPLTRNIIRMHLGEIEVKSIQNQGTTVQINIPMYKF
ncbi:sensor histidine kinase [Flavobacterium orientale]|jgi:signal transduction histidine kinase|uniref:histidine kinase n=1 Tax=Flavobacterium orientale TaxID=1756020 RepID=A0A917DF01_9FLAO|nr:ATP-binding protein [Flavobacterium orientale]GGD32393.1 two-component sensor histidine kinase [Flavobacterium orientale]